MIHTASLIGGKFNGELTAVRLIDGNLPTKIVVSDEHYYLRIPGTSCYVTCDAAGRPHVQAKVQPPGSALSKLRIAGSVPPAVR